MESEEGAVAVPAATDNKLTLEFQGVQTVEVRLDDGDEHLIEGIIQIEVSDEGMLTLYRRIGGSLRQWAGYPEGSYRWYRTVS